MEKGNKKIGICTYLHNNYGSCLQAYALSKTLNKIGYQACFFERKRTCVIAVKYALITIFTHPIRFIEKMLFKIGLKRNKVKYCMSERQINKINTFKENNLDIQYRTLNEMKKLSVAQEYTAFIAGSDQIWGGEKLYWTGFEFLTFAPDKKKIAYAPSIGTNISWYNKAKFRENIKKFNSASVREKQAADEIYAITKLRLETVSDPTILLEKKDWENLCKEVFNIDEEYILTYFLDNLSETAISHIIKLKEQSGYKIVNILNSNDICEKLDVDLNVEASPEEWVSLISKSKLICTDSFHGTMFALIFHKDFFVYERQYKETGSQSSRITNILNLTGLLNRYIVDDLRDVVSEIDWVEVDKINGENRLKSKEFLEKAIKRVNTEEV